jgi:hypothetical protein
MVPLAEADQSTAAAGQRQGSLQPLGLAPEQNAKGGGQQALDEEPHAARLNPQIVVIMPPPPSLPDPMADCHATLA